MKKIYNVFKPTGKTPFQVVKKLKQIYPALEKVKIGYAGRLDPMAEGVLLLLVGDTNKSKHSFEGLNKTYTFKAVLGIETDTYDMLGKITAQDEQLTVVNNDSIKKALSTFQSTRLQKYPPYSSIRANGKPLFYWARENKLENISIPTKEITIYSIENIQINTISASLLKEIITKKISLVEGNFRQDEIMVAWDTFFKTSSRKSFQVVEGTIHCSSGTYVRSLVHELGQMLETNAVTLSIIRTAVGKHKVDSSLELFKANKE